MAIEPSSLQPTKTAAPSGDYPWGSARNITTAGDGTGTRWDYQVLNDIWGLLQQLLTTAGVSPSGNPDKVGASQYFEALRATSGHPGFVVPLLLNDSPAVFGLRILLLDGSGVSVTTYSDLTDATWVGSAANATAGALYRADDAAGTIRNSSGNYLILPDMRGRFMRARGTIDPDYPSRTLGDNQDPAILSHGHQIYAMAPSGSSWVPIQGPADSMQVDLSGIASGSSNVWIPFNDGLVNTNYTMARVITEMHDPSGSVDYSVTDNRPYNTLVDMGVWY